MKFCIRNFKIQKFNKQSKFKNNYFINSTHFFNSKNSKNLFVPTHLTIDKQIS